MYNFQVFIVVKQQLLNLVVVLVSTNSTIGPLRASLGFPLVSELHDHILWNFCCILNFNNFFCLFFYLYVSFVLKPEPARLLSVVLMVLVA